MSLGGFFGNGGGGDAGLLFDSLYTTNYMNISPIPRHHLLSPPIVQPVFNSSALSLALKPKMEGLDEMGLIGGNFESGAMVKDREEEFESKSGSEHMEAASGDEQERPKGKSKRKKKYHRHTPYQIQELEGSFKENPHPDEKQRLELGKRLTLENKQVKFWFQNRRTQMKTQLERHENLILKQENDKLRIENIAIKEAMRNPICSGCGGGAILGEISFEENHLRIENARLKDELNRMSVLTGKFLGRPLSPLAGPFPPARSNFNLDLAVGRNVFGGLGPEEAALPMGFDFGSGVSNTVLTMPSTKPSIGMTGLNTPFEKSLLLELASNAMNELLKLTQIDSPLWLRSLNGGGEALNFEEYTRIITPCIDKTPGLRTEGTRATGLSTINSVAFVEMMMDANHWGEMFPGMIGKSYTLDVISSGMGGSIDGALQLMHAEIQVISPLVPTRQVRFLRFCKQHGDGVWAVVDVSIDVIQEVPNGQTFMHCRRLPSGCVVQDMPDGYSKIIWVEHTEYDESSIHHMYRPLLRSGMGFGAQKWVATLQRQCDFLATIMPSAGPTEDHSVITPTGKTSMAKLAQRMTRNFCAGVCATTHNWEVVQVGNVGKGARLMTRKSVHSLGEPSGIVLSATLSIWMPVQQQQLFDLLQNEELRSRWDLLSHGGQMHQMVCIAKGQDCGNKISLLSANATGGNSNQSNVLILQETSNDAFGSLIVSAAVDMSSMNVVMNGRDSACIAILPSGFAIVPDCFPDSAGPSSSHEMVGKESSGDAAASGSLLTVGFQIMINDFPAAKLTAESVETVNNLISRTIQGIKEALNCN
ncbi:Homeobox-leucine zipper protein ANTHOCYANINLESS 2 [Heracleum sosnowskyi]|uniref:Homeobox-leucine zipper protein ANTHOCYANINLESS 2 n=1 Tax=Heracleum sosnowskyi TaxID=360622 RepID=A0AAD8N147_9APIA|nr:Homeobox-leucine zipper protein ANTHOCYANINLESS 2 [Heracleum sosnowskyi]